MKTASRCWCIHTHPVTVNTKRNFYTRSNLLFLSLFLICIFGLLSFRSYTPAVCVLYIYTHYGWIQIELLSTWENRLTNSRVTRAHNKLKKNISSVVLPLFFFSPCFSLDANGFFCQSTMYRRPSFCRSCFSYLFYFYFLVEFHSKNYVFTFFLRYGGIWFSHLFDAIVLFFEPDDPFSYAPTVEPSSVTLVIRVRQLKN